MQKNRKEIRIHIVIGNVVREGDKAVLYRPSNKNYYVLVDKKIKNKLKNKENLIIKQYL